MPEKRVNKNGVAVTKHVRAGTAPVSKMSLPAPALSGDVSTADKPALAPTAGDLRERLRERFTELNSGFERRVPDFGYEMPYIDKFPDTVRQGIYDFLGSAKESDVDKIEQFFMHDYEKPNLFSAFVNTIGDIRWIDSCRYAYAAKRSVGNFRSLFDRLMLGKVRGDVDGYHFDVMKAEHIAATLQLSADDFSLPHQYYSEIETLRKNLGTIMPALPVVFAVAIAREDAHIARLSDRSLPQSERVYKPMSGNQVVEIAEYAQQRPERMEMIAATIRERGEFDPELIDTMVASGASAVASGTL